MKYHITLEVEDVSGYQTFSVDAESKAKALEIFEKHGGDFVCEEVEVTSLSSADINDIEEINKPSTK